MDNEKIIRATIDVFQNCNIHSFPLDCIEILTQYNYKVYTYEQLLQKNRELYNMCIGYSDDAFCDKRLRLIAYNEKRPEGRIRFSLMHELGHHVLNHTGASRQNEKEANAFASNILAPRMAIHYARCKNANDVSRAFNMSYEAADNACIDYRRWHRNVAIYKMSKNDKALYSHFYNCQEKCFIWSKKKCSFCGRTIYNTLENHCDICYLPPYTPEKPVCEDIFAEENERVLHKQQLKWLYDF